MVRQGVHQSWWRAPPAKRSPHLRSGRNRHDRAQGSNRHKPRLLLLLAQLLLLRSLPRFVAVLPGVAPLLGSPPRGLSLGLLPLPFRPLGLSLWVDLGVPNPLAQGTACQAFVPKQLLRLDRPAG